MHDEERPSTGLKALAAAGSKIHAGNFFRPETMLCLQVVTGIFAHFASRLENDFGIAAHHLAMGVSLACGVAALCLLWDRVKAYTGSRLKAIPLSGVAGALVVAFMYVQIQTAFENREFHDYFDEDDPSLVDAVVPDAGASAVVHAVGMEGPPQPFVDRAGRLVVVDFAGKEWRLPAEVVEACWRWERDRRKPKGFRKR